jgi:hypothetical protein
MVQRIRFFICSFSFFVFISGAHGQTDTTGQAKRFADALHTTVHDFHKTAAGDTTLQVIERLSKYDTLLKRELYNYYKFGLDHRKMAFEWNLLSSKITFWVVIILVFTGIIFAGIQFYVALKGNANKKLTSLGEASSETAQFLKTELEAGTQGIKISSPVLGVIILVISLLFFYLYLAYVYPIQENF